MLSSVESLVPILTTQVFTRVYTATREMTYPLPGTCYFINSGAFLLGAGLVVVMAVSLRCGHLTDIQEVEEALDKDKKEQMEDTTKV